MSAQALAVCLNSYVRHGKRAQLTQLNNVYGIHQRNRPRKMNASAWTASLIVSEASPMDGRLFNTPDMISIRSPRHKLLSSPLSSLTSSAERRITSSAYYPRITEPFQACWFVSSGVLTVTISPQCPALQKTESSVKVKLKDTLRRQYVPRAGASTRSTPPPHRAPRKSP